MQGYAIIRNFLIFAGIGIGGILAVVGAIRSNPDQQPSDDAPEPQAIVLNTAKPPALGATPFGSPISLNSGFGRGELTGHAVTHVPANPVEELQFNRGWDVQLSLRAPAPPVDLPPDAASDEVAEPERIDRSLKDAKLADMPDEARQRAEAALVSMRAGNELLKEGSRMARMPGEDGVTGNLKIREAANLYRDARDKLTAALEIAPNHPELLMLMQETKANLYICMKHGK